MPGLLRAMGRTAVVAGTATAVSNRVSRRQANRWSEQEGQRPQQPRRGATSPSPPRPLPSRIDQLTELGELHAKGILTDEEFAAEKAKILGS